MIVSYKYLNMKKIYIVSYKEGDWDSEYEVFIFATCNKKVATNYKKRFDKILKKLKKHYSKYEVYKNGNKWLSEEHIEIFERWCRIKDAKPCIITEVEQR